MVQVGFPLRAASLASNTTLSAAAGHACKSIGRARFIVKGNAPQRLAACRAGPRSAAAGVDWPRAVACCLSRNDPRQACAAVAAGRFVGFAHRQHVRHGKTPAGRRAVCHSTGIVFAACWTTHLAIRALTIRHFSLLTVPPVGATLPLSSSVVLCRHSPATPMAHKAMILAVRGPSSSRPPVALPPVAEFGEALARLARARHSTAV
jgi:hypothetical protein